MCSNIIRAVNKKKNGNLLLIAVIMIILPILTISMAQLMISSEAYQVRTIQKFEDRYLDFSKAEIGVYSVIDQIEGQYLDEISISNIKSNAESLINTTLNLETTITIEDNIQLDGTLKIKVSSTGQKKPAYIISSINLIEEITEIETAEGAIENIRYIIDCSNCQIERLVSYYD